MKFAALCAAIYWVACQAADIIDHTAAHLGALAF